MFTGLIADIGKVEKISASGAGITVTIKAGPVLKKLKKGGSIAVDGLCLTATSVIEKSFTADISPESLGISTARFFKTGKMVNLELPVAAGEPLGGHFVTGHVDGTGQLIKIEKQKNYLKMTFGVKAKLTRAIVAKGSIAIDGISLTVNEASAEFFSVMLIPETIKNTTLPGKKFGELVNIETDLLLKPQIKNDMKEETGLTWEKLTAAGY